MGLGAPWPPAAGRSHPSQLQSRPTRGPTIHCQTFSPHCSPVETQCPWEPAYVHRKSAWSRLHLAEAAVLWVSHVHLRQEERQTRMAAEVHPFLQPGHSRELAWQVQGKQGLLLAYEDLSLTAGLLALILSLQKEHRQQALSLLESWPWRLPSSYGTVTSLCLFISPNKPYLIAYHEKLVCTSTPPWQQHRTPKPHTLRIPFAHGRKMEFGWNLTQA